MQPDRKPYPVFMTDNDPEPDDPVKTGLPTEGADEPLGGSEEEDP